MMYTEFDDVKNEKYNVYECDWTKEVVDYDDLYIYDNAEVSIQALETYFYEQGEEIESELAYDPIMQEFLEEDDIRKHIYKYYDRAYE